MADVFKNFAEQKPNPKHLNAVRWQNSGRSNVFCEAGTLYSYGYHFPLAILLGVENPGTDKVRYLFAKNGDRSSNTTSGHQSCTQRACVGPTLSRACLISAGIEFERLVVKSSKTVQGMNTIDGPAVVYWRPDVREFIYWDKRAKKYFVDDYSTRKRKEFIPPEQGMFVPHDPKHYGYDAKDTKAHGVWHVLGAAVIENKCKYFLCSLDGNAYFVAELAKKPRSVEDAFESFKPAEVRKAEKAGKKVLRQGEWFFVETGLDDAGMAKKVGFKSKTAFLEAAPVGVLPRQSDTSNRHEVKLYLDMQKSGKKPIFAKGKVFHRNAHNNELTKSHQTLNLGDL